MDVRILGASDIEFYDLQHATNKVTLREIIYMTERDARLKQYLDTKKLKELLYQNANSDFLNI